MSYIICIIISFAASIVGSICGIGGGVIIKPVLDTVGLFGVSTINFLSGCTVLAMSTYSVGGAIRKKESALNLRISTPLALGAVFGGIIGKNLFYQLTSVFENQNQVGAIQSSLLCLLTIGTLVYTIKKQSIKGYQTENLMMCVLIGLLLGLISSFLGIGGGPINLVILHFFFSMNTKVAAQNSLYIILFSQISSLVNTVVAGAIPDVDIILLVSMMLCGILGALLGRRINKNINEQTVNKLFIILMILIIFINLFNTYKFLK